MFGHRTGSKNHGGATAEKSPAGGGLWQSMASLWKQASAKSKNLASSSSPRKLMSTISNKAIKFRQRKRVSEEFDGVLWQKTILMGGKCQPLDFSGVIYYDSHGNQVEELPVRSSPRASPLPSYDYYSDESNDRSRVAW